MNNLVFYEEKKKKLQQQLISINGEIGIDKKYSNLFRSRENNNKNKLDVSDFNNVIEINKSSKLAIVEGMTPFDVFVEKTLEYGLMPLVVPQLKSITIGGAVTGLGIESSSFRYGLVHESVTEIEILLPDGKIVIANKENEYKDIFYGFPNSYGTLGYILKLTVKLVETKKFVQLKHTIFDNVEDFFKNLEEISINNREINENNIDFIDGSYFGTKEIVLTTAKFVNQAPYISDYTEDNIYYKSLIKKKEDFLTTQDYIWRWDTDWFWCSKAFGVENPIVRKIWGKKRLNSRTYWKIRKYIQSNSFLKSFLENSSKEEIIQDIEIPIENCSKWVDFFIKNINIVPFWICPMYSPSKNFTSLYQMEKNKLYVNFGFWSSISTKKENGYYNKLIEEEVIKLGGKKSLYSTVYYNKKNFWEIYNKDEYFRLKKKYDPNNKFKDLYTKVVGKK